MPSITGEVFYEEDTPHTRESCKGNCVVHEPLTQKERLELKAKEIEEEIERQLDFLIENVHRMNPEEIKIVKEMVKRLTNE